MLLCPGTDSNFVVNISCQDGQVGPRLFNYSTMAASKNTPLLIPSSITPHQTPLETTPIVYFLKHCDSNASHHTSTSHHGSNSAIIVQDAGIETILEGGIVEDLNPRPVSLVVTSLGNNNINNNKISPHNHGWFDFFDSVGKKSSAFVSTTTGGTAANSVIDQFSPNSPPVKNDPKVFFANKRIILAWMHVSVILAGRVWQSMRLRNLIMTLFQQTVVWGYFTAGINCVYSLCNDAV